MKDSTRIYLTKKQIESLEIKYCDSDVIWNAMEQWAYNPVFLYPKSLKKIKGERGHDDKYRYVFKNDKKKELKLKFREVLYSDATDTNLTSYFESDSFISGMFGTYRSASDKENEVKEAICHVFDRFIDYYLK